MKLKIERMTYGPDAVAHTEDGKTVFVTGAVTGDVVDATVTKDAKSFMRATTKEILEPSALREQAVCPYFGICGGCPWGGLSREAQLEEKQSNVRFNLMKIGHFSEDEVDSLLKDIAYDSREWGYRNKIELTPFKQNGKLSFGMHGLNNNQMINVKKCPLFEKSQAGAIKSVAGALSYLSNSRELDIERVGIRASRRTKDLEIALWTPTGPFPRAQVTRVLQDAVKSSSIVRVMSKGDKRARKVSSVEALSGAGSWSEQICGETMRLSAPSFFQVNTSAAEILINAVIEGLDPQEGELAVDLYCGAGTFTLPLARKCDFVAAVEAYGPAVRDLRRNLEIANIDWVDVIGGDAAREFPDEEADILVVDPPRAGLAEEVVDLICNTNARAVAYVSCDPATLARDLRRFIDRGIFAPQSILPVDLFPQTFHVETVTILKRVAK